MRVAADKRQSLQASLPMLYGSKSPAGFPVAVMSTADAGRSHVPFVV